MVVALIDVAWSSSIWRGRGPRRRGSTVDEAWWGGRRPRRPRPWTGLGLPEHSRGGRGLPLTWFGVVECETVVVVVLDDGGGRSGGGGSGKGTDGLRLNRASRFGHARAAPSDGHALTFYYQTKRRSVRSGDIFNIRGEMLFPPIF